MAAKKRSNAKKKNSRAARKKAAVKQRALTEAQKKISETKDNVKKPRSKEKTEEIKEKKSSLSQENVKVKIKEENKEKKTAPPREDSVKKSKSEELPIFENKAFSSNPVFQWHLVVIYLILGAIAVYGLYLFKTSVANARAAARLANEMATATKQTISAVATTVYSENEEENNDLSEN